MTKSSDEGHIIQPHFLVKVCSVTKSSGEGHIIGPHLVEVHNVTKSSDEGYISDHIWSKSAVWQSTPTRGIFQTTFSRSSLCDEVLWLGVLYLNEFSQNPLCDKVLRQGAMIFLSYLVNVHCVTMTPNGERFSFRPYLVQYCFFNFQRSSFTVVHSLDSSSMSNPTKTTYMAFYPKRNDIIGAPDQVFKFDNFLTHLMGGIKANTIVAIGTINPGSLCLQ